MAYVALGQACPVCTIPYGERCVPCPEGSDMPECAGCVGGRLVEAKPKFWEHPLFASVATGVAVTVLTSIIVARIMGRNK